MGEKQYEHTLFIFRRDLRLEDNKGLQQAFARSKRVSCCFIFDPRQIDFHPYRSAPALVCMVNSLGELAEQIQGKGGELHFFHGDPVEIVRELVKANQLSSVMLNIDYTPFSRERDKAIKDAVESSGAVFHAFHDALLNRPGGVLKKDGTPYSVYTPFLKASRKIAVDEPVPFAFEGVGFDALGSGPSESHPLQDLSPYAVQEPFRVGGRAEALSILDEIERFANYQEERDFPDIRGTTGLAAHLKFGTLSVREAYSVIAEHLGAECTLINQLYWRDFFSHIGFFFPHVYGGSFRPEYDGIEWNESDEEFERWCAGQTGFPIVDAGMRELLATGYMHNRVRMITASFLVKDLHIDWRKGERHFAQHLIDYDPAVNNGSWQWAASTGCDAQPYFRIFNPWRQQERFDPECGYIKKWVPELTKLEPKSLHKLNEFPDLVPSDYFSPLVEHHIAKERAVELFKRSKEEFSSSRG